MQEHKKDVTLLVQTSRPDEHLAHPSSHLGVTGQMRSWQGGCQLWAMTCCWTPLTSLSA